jgi:multidrug efflux pump subunit AcrA (membrane-fusion protein)
MLRKVIVSLVLVAVVLGVSAGGAVLLMSMRTPPQRRGARQDVPRVVAPPVTAQSGYRMQVVGYGPARPRRSVRVIAEVGGQVVKKFDVFDTGRFVSRGDELLRIDPTDYRQQRDAARSQLELIAARLAVLEQQRVNARQSLGIETDRLEVVQEQYQRTKDLFDKGLSSQNELDADTERMLQQKQAVQRIANEVALIEPQRKQLQAEQTSVQVQLSQALTALERTTCEAPIAGVVASDDVEEGERVAPGTVCGEIYSLDVMEVAVSIPATELKWLGTVPLASGGEGEAADASPIDARVEWQGGGEDRTRVFWDGTVVRVEPGLEPETRTVRVIVRVDNPLGGDPNRIETIDFAQRPLLDRNMFCRVEIEGRRLDRAFVLPRNAVRPDGTVFVVDEQDRLRLRNVQVARFTRGEAIVRAGSGLEAGLRVVTSYLNAPVLGMKVEPVGRQGAPARPMASSGSDERDRPADAGPSDANDQSGPVSRASQ